MNRALLVLMIVQYKALVRRALRGARSWRGAFLLLFTLGFFAVTVGPQIAISMTMGDRPEMKQISGVFEPVAPLYLLGFTMLYVFTAAGEVAVSFTPAEVDFLFAGPFSRRELLLYKLARTGLAVVMVSVFITMMTLMNLRWWFSGFVGIVMAMAMVQLVGMIAALGGQILGEAAYTRARKLLLLAMAIVTIWGASQIAGRVRAAGLQGALGALRDSPGFRVLVAPFEIFTRAALAGRLYPDLVGWGAAAMAIDAALVVLLLKLDANYIETAATISQRVYERIRRAKQGGGFAMPVGSRAGRLRLPGLPWLVGIGPVAWRQLLIVLRTSRGLLISSLLVVGMMVGGFSFSTSPLPGGAGAAVVPWIAIGMVFYLTFLFSMQLPWAFRGDLDHIEALKTLPIRPWALAAGELAGGVLILSAIQMLAFGLVGALVPSGWPILLTASAFCPPFNAITLAVNNLLFLLYPVRLPAGTTFDFQMFGRMMLFFALQFVLLVPMLGIPAGIGLAAYFLSGYSWPAFAATAWVVLVAELPPIALAVAWAFWRFDVSTQAPA